MIRRPASVALAVALLVPAPLPGGAQSASTARATLSVYFRASDDEFTRLERGEPVSRNLQGADGREVAVAGVIRARCSPERFRERMLDIVRFKASSYVLEIGRFSHEPIESDLASLRLEALDADALKGCR